MGEELRKFFEQHVSLEQGAWEEMQNALKRRSLKKKEHFLKQGEICRHIGFIIKGYVRLYYLVDGEEITKDFNFENSFCGSWASFSMQEPSRFNVFAMENSDLYLIPREGLYKLFDKYRSVERIGRLTMEHMFIKKELRESSFLLDSAEKRYIDLQLHYPGIEQRVPLKYLASYLGISAETLSRLRKF